MSPNFLGKGRHLSSGSTTITTLYDLKKSADHNPVDSATQGNKHDVLAARGTVNRGVDTSTRITCTFAVTKQQKTFDCTLTPALPAFTSKTVIMKYPNEDNLAGTYCFSGYIGEKDCKITIEDKGVVVITIAGELNEPGIRNRNQVKGTGVWMST